MVSIEESCVMHKRCNIRNGDGCSLNCRDYRWNEKTYPTSEERLNPFQRKLVAAMVRMNHDFLDLAKASGLPLHTVRMSLRGDAIVTEQSKIAIARGLHLDDGYFDKPLEQAG
jgi:hypothetical protein